MRFAASIIFFLVLTGTAQAWDLVLPDSATVRGPQVRLGDVVQSSVPAAAKDLLIQNARRPGTVESVSRRMILRQLVSQGLAAGVRFGGAEICRIHVSGQEVPATELTAEISAVVQNLVPAKSPGAPDSWFDMDIPNLPVHLQERPLVTIKDGRLLTPGRNQIRAVLEAGGRVQEVPVTVTLHAFGEVATARKAINRDVSLTEELFNWEWRDLAVEGGDPALNREAVLDFSSTRSLSAGDRLRSDDMKPTPVVRVGDAVDLMIIRGPVTAAVRAIARQAGSLGQTIPVRSELTGRLVNARVTGPGLVEWRR